MSKVVPDARMEAELVKLIPDFRLLRCPKSLAVRYRGTDYVMKSSKGLSASCDIQLTASELVGMSMGRRAAYISEKTTNKAVLYLVEE